MGSAAPRVRRLETEDEREGGATTKTEEDQEQREAARVDEAHGFAGARVHENGVKTFCPAKSLPCARGRGGGSAGGQKPRQ